MNKDTLCNALPKLSVSSTTLKVNWQTEGMNITPQILQPTRASDLGIVRCWRYNLSLRNTSEYPSLGKGNPGCIRIRNTSSSLCRTLYSFHKITIFFIRPVHAILPMSCPEQSYLSLIPRTNDNHKRTTVVTEPNCKSSNA